MNINALTVIIRKQYGRTTLNQSFVLDVKLHQRRNSMSSPNPHATQLIFWKGRNMPCL